MNQMFTTTYGRLFTQNVRVFQELFSELRKYYSGGLSCFVLYMETDHGVDRLMQCSTRCIGFGMFWGQN